jgi:hypothetical protein
MLRIITIAIFMIGFISLNAQVKTPAPSPACKVEQSVGLTDITIEYSRPSVKDRDIFGGLVPYGKMWRTGANKNSILTFSTDVKIEGQDVKAGSYALFTTPGASTWDIVFYSDTENWGVPSEWDEEKVAAKASVKSEKIGVDVESFLINITNLRNTSATIELIWENTLVPINIEVPTDDLVQSSIDKTFAGASGGDYYSAARYYREQGKDLDKALAWMNKALEMNGEKFWVVRQKSLIQADMKDYKGAVASAKRSLELAKEAGNDDYVRMNEKSIGEWQGMMK